VLTLVTIATTAHTQALISIAHFISRVHTNRIQLKAIPRPYMPTKALDLDQASGACTTCRADVPADAQKVADHIMTEYSRTAVIAHIGQATTDKQEGWGAPGGLY
jgi:hypothetical protein